MRACGRDYQPPDLDVVMRFTAETVGHFCIRRLSDIYEPKIGARNQRWSLKLEVLGTPTF
jgi:hypothetical protein